MRAAVARAAIVFLSALSLDCGGGHQEITGPTTLNPERLTAVPLSVPETSAPAAILPPEVFVGAGDIAMCGGGGNSEATARLLDRIGGTVFTLGDNAYFTGSAQEYRDCYDRTWGRHKSRTRPIPGNHEYETPGASGYFDYFGASAGPSGLGYYSYNLGNWHIVALNSGVPVGSGSAQAAWLRADLAASRARCTLAYSHFPLFSSGNHGDQRQMRDLWRILYEAGGEVMLSGHDHLYERFAPQSPDGFPEPATGIRQFVVGTGGAAPYQFTTVRPNSEVRLIGLGVLKLTLNADGYAWDFISVAGPGDSGSASCH